MIFRYIDEGTVGCGMGLFLIWDPLAEDSATKLKTGQLYMCTLYLYGVWCTLFPPVAEICARLAGNFCQTTVKSGAYDMVWLNVWYFTASYRVAFPPLAPIPFLFLPFFFPIPLPSLLIVPYPFPSSVFYPSPYNSPSPPPSIFPYIRLQWFWN